jgi:hypothetical protein
MRTLRAWYYRFVDFFEMVHEMGVDVIGGALQAACVVLLAMLCVIEVFRFVHSHPHLLHIFGW